MLFQAQLGFILLSITVSVTGEKCSGSTYCTSGGFYWCCASDAQCGMNMGTCFSQKNTDEVLIIAGIIGGAFLLCCITGIFYAIRSSHMKEKRAEEARKRLSLQPSRFSVPTQLSIIGQTTPTSFANPLPINSMSPINMINSTPRPSGEVSAYDHCMKYLTKADQLIQNGQSNNHSQV